MAFKFEFGSRRFIRDGPRPEDITVFFSDVLSTDSFLQINAADNIVKWLQNADPMLINDALDLLVTRGVVKKFVEFFRSDDVNLQDKASIVFGFLACGDTRHATIAYNSGIVPACIERLSSPDPEVRVKSAWILGNLAADDVECADALVGLGVLNIMVEQTSVMIGTNEMQTYITYATMLLWAINHFLKSAQDLPTALVLRIQELLCTIIMSNVEDTILEECCFGLATILQINSEAGALFGNDKICGRLVRLLERGSNVNIQKAALQLVGALTAKSEEHTTRLLNNNLLSALSDLVEHQLGEDACWVISNIIAESVEHLNLIVYHPKILPTVVRLLKVDASGFDEDEFGGRSRESCAILANIINKGQVEAIRHTVALGGLSGLCVALRYSIESDILVLILDALWKLILFGEHDPIEIDGAPVNLYLKLFESSGGFEGLARLENRKDRPVAEAAQQMLALIDEIMNPPMTVDNEAEMTEDTPANGHPPIASHGGPEDSKGEEPNQGGVT